ncbi:MAG: MoxR family ATPase [Anaerolineae bacterium]|nr:MoxR family ATPase [Anaerolineae bacterium]
METREVQEAAARIRANVSQVIVGKDDVVDLLVVALLCEGHVLLEDVPGIGKTTLAKALARSLGCSFQRVQFTPDLLPSDITGVSVYNQKTGDFEYRPGPVMSQILLADEINRAGPRTQSALLEVMQEQQVTVDGVTRAVPRPFLVLATQNPIELEGTFPLPEAQVDRFLMRVALGYPDFEEERAIMRRFRDADPLRHLEPVVSADEVLQLGAICRQVFMHEVIESYIISLVRRTRRHEALALGVSPRGSLALMRTSQAFAAMQGRNHVRPDDVQAMAKPVLAHRLLPSVQTRLRGHATDDILNEILEQVPVPVEKDWAVEELA